jgi:hypothetical protein
MSEDVYTPVFPDGTPVTLGRYQEWLDMLKDDPDLDPEAYKVAEALIAAIRRRLN